MGWVCHDGADLTPKYEIFIASGTNIKYMETACNKDIENDKQN